MMEYPGNVMKGKTIHLVPFTTARETSTAKSMDEAPNSAQTETTTQVTGALTNTMGTVAQSTLMVESTRETLRRVSQTAMVLPTN